jgi:30S ribosomal protein S31
MGKGDRKTAKGKRNISSYGNARSSVTKTAATTSAPVVKKAAVVAKKTTAAKPAPAKKTAK